MIKNWLLCAKIESQYMKKWIVWLLVLSILTIIGIYLFIPAKIAISRIITADATITGEFRYISQEVKWEKWWRDAEGNAHQKGEPFSYNGTTFRLTDIQHNIAGIEIEQEGVRLQSILHLISFKKDSTGAVWQCVLPAGNDPVSRLSSYRKALAISKNMNGVLVNLKKFISDPLNVYEVAIHRTSFRDTTMLSARYTTSMYPGPVEIYGYLSDVEKSIQKQKGIISDYPLVNVRMLDSGQYETQVAIPTSRELKDDGKIFFRHMVPGNFLTAEVKGGPYAIREAMQQLDFFLRDNNKIQMAKPFEQLVTNRITQPDTSKWITRVFLPVVE
jgi:hypothetical protein